MEPWNDPAAPAHVRTRQPVMRLNGPVGPRVDLPRRRKADELPKSLQGVDFGIVVMSHFGAGNGRLSVLLSSIPENYPVVISSDAIDPQEIEADREVAAYHGADFRHCTPWGGRARNAQHCMEVAPWERVLFLCDDVWLFPEAVSDALRWFCCLERHDVPLACLGLPGRETYADHASYGFSSWQQCLDEPWRFEAVPPHPGFLKGPLLHKNPFGAAMVMSRRAYQHLGGFASEYWAHDDVFNHKIWLSGRWVAAIYPGRGYMHLGAQSWHHGETKEYVGEFHQAAGMTADESGKRQYEAIVEWNAKLGRVFESLGGS